MAAFTSFIFPPSSSHFLSALSLITLIATASLGIAEITGKHLQYAKFANAVAGNSSKKIQLPSRIGMLLCYTPAFVAGLVSFLLFPYQISSRILALKSVLVLHFFKRIFEVLFVHKYSNKMDLEITIMISFSYILFTTSTIYAQTISQQFPEPEIDLKHAGLVLYSIGITGNFYHHFLLSKLRKEGDKQYKIPKGGLFELVICPHYLFEIIEFFGISFISQTLFSFFFTLGSAVYLTCRSYTTKNWYLSKFEDFPKHLKAILPFLF